MIIRVNSLMRKLIILMVIMQFSYFKLLGAQLPIFSTPYLQFPLVIFYIVMVSVICFMVLSQPPIPNKYLLTLSTLVILSVGIGIYSAVQNNGVGIMDALSQGISYLYILLAIPIFNLLVNKKWDFRSLLKMLVFLGLGAYLLRIFISMYHGMTGIVLFPNIAQESAAENWIRNGVLRINPPFIGIMFVPIVYYLAITTESESHKVWYCILIIGAILYTIQVNQTRSLMIYQIVTLVVLLIFEKVNDKKKLFRIILLLLGVIVIVNTPWFNKLLDSFSKSSRDYGGSTIARINVIVRFGAMYLQNPFWGFGFLKNSSQSLNIGGHLADIGILGSVYSLGIPILIVYVMIFFRSYYVFRQVKSVGMMNESLLVLGMGTLAITTGINIDIFYAIFAFAMPFYMAITEYILFKAKELEEWEILEE